MNTGQIDFLLARTLKRTGCNFLGVFPSDQIPISSLIYPCCFVANSDPEHQPGSHWLAFYYESPDVLEFFDSYGMHPSQYGFNLTASVSFNPVEFQSYSSNVCGGYCIYFLCKRSRSNSLSDIIARLMKCGPCTDHCIKEFTIRLIDYNYHKLPSLCTNQSCTSRNQ